MVFRNLRERFGIDDQDYQVRGAWPALRIWKRGSGLRGWAKGLPGSGPSLPRGRQLESGEVEGRRQLLHFSPTPPV